MLKCTRIEIANSLVRLRVRFASELAHETRWKTRCAVLLLRAKLHVSRLQRGMSLISDVTCCDHNVCDAPDRAVYAINMRHALRN